METPIIKVYQLIEAKFNLLIAGLNKQFEGKKRVIAEFKQLKELPQVDINDLQKEFLLALRLKNREEFEYLKRYYAYIVKNMLIYFQMQVDELLIDKKSPIKECLFIIKNDIDRVKNFIYTELDIYEKTLIYNSDFPIKSELIIDETEPMPDYNYSSTQQKIAWLKELGIINLILERTKKGEFFNPSRTANVISSFCDVKPATLRKAIDAIIKPNGNNRKNNPETNASNRLFVDEMLKKFRMEKVK